MDVMHGVAPVTARQFAWFRIIFGAYLAIHFAHLVPWGAELFSRQGVIPGANLEPQPHSWHFAQRAGMVGFAGICDCVSCRAGRVVSSLRVGRSASRSSAAGVVRVGVSVQSQRADQQSVDRVRWVAAPESSVIDS